MHIRVCLCWPSLCHGFKRGANRQAMCAYTGVFVLSVAVLLLIAAAWPPFILVRF
jgi:hypothetical protein